MYPSIVDYLDIDAEFDPPAACTPDQLVHCQEIRYNLQTSFVLAVDAYISIRYRQGIQADPAFRIPAPYTAKVKNMQAAGAAFFDYWRSMPELPTFPRFPKLKHIPVAGAAGRRKRQRVDHEAPILPPMPGFVAAAPAPQCATTISLTHLILFSRFLLNFLIYIISPELLLLSYNSSHAYHLIYFSKSIYCAVNRPRGIQVLEEIDAQMTGPGSKTPMHHASWRASQRIIRAWHGCAWVRGMFLP
jgi:hypothetical protein